METSLRSYRVYAQGIRRVGARAYQNGRTDAEN